MAEGKEKISFILYKSQRTLFVKLTNEQAGKLIKQIFSYVCCENPTETDDDKVNYGFEFIKQSLENDLDIWKDTCKKRTDAINKRWQGDKAQKNTSEYKCIQENTKHTDNEYEYDNEYDNDKYKENNSISNDIQKEIDTSSQYRSSLFDRFWKHYPKKIGKEKCKSWFMAKSRKLDNDLVTKMITSLEYQKCSEQWMKDNGQFIPNPYTWLNQKRWEDEGMIETASAYTNSKSQEEQETQEVSMDDFDLSMVDEIIEQARNENSGS